MVHCHKLSGCFGWRWWDTGMKCWRLFLPHFRTVGCTKYALDAFRLHIQLKTMSTNLAHQVKRHQFVNTRGGPGMNIPCDLHNEHVNTVVTLIIRNMSPNLTEQALQWAVWCISPLVEICRGFDTSSQVPIITSAHSTNSDVANIGRLCPLFFAGIYWPKWLQRDITLFPRLIRTHWTGGILRLQIPGSGRKRGSMENTKGGFETKMWTFKIHQKRMIYINKGHFLWGCNTHHSKIIDLYLAWHSYCWGTPLAICANAQLNFQGKPWCHSLHNGMKYKDLSF